MAALAWSTFPDRESANSIVAIVLEERLIACANLLPAVDAVFEWQGKVERSVEIGVLFKTKAETLDVLIERLGELHPYELPAIIGWTCQASHPETLAWLSNLVPPPLKA